MSMAAASGFDGASDTSPGTVGATITKFTGGDIDPSGFSTCTDKFAATERSWEVRVVEQSPALAQTVVRGAPPIKIVALCVEGLTAKLPPSTRTVNPPAAPASVLAGRMAVIAGAVEIVTLAAPVREASSELVAVIAMASGDGAEMGAVKTPLPLITPHAPAALHPGPLTFQITS
jgi:hypothetical protein